MRFPRTCELWCLHRWTQQNEGITELLHILEIAMGVMGASNCNWVGKSSLEPSRDRAWNRVAHCPWNLNFRTSILEAGIDFSSSEPIICERLRNPGNDSEKIDFAKAWRAGTTNKVVVPVRQAGNRFLGSLKGLQTPLNSLKQPSVLSLSLTVHSGMGWGGGWGVGCGWDFEDTQAWNFFNTFNLYDPKGL